MIWHLRIYSLPGRCELKLFNSNKIGEDDEEFYSVLDQEIDYYV